MKDLEDCAGLITSHGSVPYKNNLATHDSVQVERLRAAGAIPIGKTNAPEFGYTAITKNLIFGVTRKPVERSSRTPGGSSGGSSAALSRVHAAAGDRERRRRLDAHSRRASSARSA